jgi:hypothetical protein
MRFAGGIQSGVSKKKREEKLKDRKETEESKNKNINGRSNKYKISDRSVQSLDEIRIDFSNLKIINKFKQRKG